MRLRTPKNESPSTLPDTATGLLRIANYLLIGLFVACSTSGLRAQQPMNTPTPLDRKQQAIVTISAFTAKGDLPPLRNALTSGLDAGLTISEIKEVLVQLYTYTGFPRSLNALNTFMTVLNERRQRGLNDPAGKEPSPLPTDKSRRQFGTDTQTKLLGTPAAGDIYTFAPLIDQFLKEHLFGDIFGRDNLDWKTRELATISALASLGSVESQLRAHFGIGLHNGLTADQFSQLVAIIHANVGAKEGREADQVWQAVRNERAQKPATR